MDNTPGPALMRQMLARELKRLREESGLGADDAARALGCNRTRISHLETGRNPPVRADIEILCPLYGVPGQVENLILMLESANAHDRWPVRGMPSTAKKYLGFEENATRLHRFSLEAIPGILQSPDYARAVLQVYDTPVKDIESHVAIRVYRWQRILDGKMTVSAILSEGALARTSYLGKIGYDQLKLLSARMDAPGMTLRVIPYSAGLYQGLTASFTILMFPEGTSTPMVLHEGGQDSVISFDYTEVSQLERTYRKLEDVSLDKDGTEEKIAEYIDDAKEITNAFPRRRGDRGTVLA
jgi:transcriptional regulator with XRE-family HTH domain